MTADALLTRLARVRQTGPGRWIARCPGHEDRTPSLSIRELEDGRVLLKCFAGCGAVDVINAAGLDWQALFPPKLEHSHRASYSRIPARDLLEILDHEVMVAWVILGDVLKARIVDEQQLSRLAQCAARIGKARDHVRA